jgi:hypothetical protein
LSSEAIIRNCELGGGLLATVRDCTSHYFGGYYHVRILITADVPVDSSAFENAAQYEDALVRLGSSVSFSRTLEKMAVPEADIADIRRQLMDSFYANVLPYLRRADFAPGFIRSEYRKKLASAPRGYC